MVKLFVIPARNATTALILRRGPSAWYHLIEWDTRRDRFTHGAWIKARIYEQNCDLSPNGRLFVYSVHQGSRGGTDMTHAWTAVSRSPWLHALVVWPQGTTYGGGGRFEDDKTLLLRGVPCLPSPRPLEQVPWRLQVIHGDPPLHDKGEVVSDADWSGHDPQGDLVFTHAGQLLRRRKRKDIVVADFTNLNPNPEPAPDWATRPL